MSFISSQAIVENYFRWKKMFQLWESRWKAMVDVTFPAFMIFIVIVRLKV